MSCRLQPSSRSQRGAAAVELALLLILLLLITAGIVGFGRTFWYYNALAKATRDGARAMSMANKDTISTVAVPAAKALVVAAVNGANLLPALTAANVSVTCSPACDDGSAPDNVTVQITGYTIDIGGLFPFIAPDGTISRFADTPLSPYTTMRYMN
jgi:Flp pilus assembly protein TadG